MEDNYIKVTRDEEQNDCVRVWFPEHVALLSGIIDGNKFYPSKDDLWDCLSQEERDLLEKKLGANKNLTIKKINPEVLKATWKIHNILLQEAYINYKKANTKKEKNKAALDIQRELKWWPFANYIARYPLAEIEGIERNGPDSIIEYCIGEIDLIARGDIDFPNDLG